MKKRIISVLSLLMLVIGLTGCSTQVTQAKIEEMTAIAQNIKDTPNYQLPEDYTFTYADSMKNDRIILTTQEEFSNRHQIKATFDVSKEKVELLHIKVVYDDEIGGNMLTLLWGICVIIFVLSNFFGRR